MTNEVHAVIELRITPQRECGFGKIAEKVAKYEQVEACFLISTECSDFNSPRSCMRTASAWMSLRNLTKDTASAISESLMSVFTVTWTFTPWSWQ